MKQKFKFLASFMALLVAMVCMSLVAFADEPSPTPEQVTGLKQVSASSSSVGLVYDTQLIADGYVIELSDDGKTWGAYEEECYNGEAYGFGLSAGKTYYARVKAYTTYYDNGTQHVYGAPSAVIKVVTEVDKVNNFKQTAATTNSMTFTWDKVAGATGYYVYQDIDNSGNPKLVATVSTNKATIKGLKNSNEYKFTITAFAKGSTYTAVSSYEASLYSYDLRLVPAKINTKNLVNDSFYSSGAKAYFNYEKAPYTDGYEMRAYAYDKNKEVSKVTTKSSWECLKNIKANMFYKVKVRGYSVINGQKKYGAWSSFKYIAHNPNVDVRQAGSKKQLNLKWDKVKGATSYTVYMSTKRTGGYKKVATVKKTSTVVSKLGKTKLKGNKEYYVYVVANRKVGKTTYTSDGIYCMRYKLK